MTSRSAPGQRETSVRAAHATVIASLVERGVPLSAGVGIMDAVHDRAGREFTEQAVVPPAWVRETAGEIAAIGGHPVGPLTVDPGAARERLALLVTCCHRELPEAARVAAALRIVAGLSPAQTGAAFAVPETTMAARLDRVLTRLDGPGMAFTAATSDLTEHLGCVLDVVSLVFDEGHLGECVEIDLEAEAISLGRLVLEACLDEPEAQALLALMLLVHARRDARRDARRADDGTLVPLGRQDRTRWHAREVEEGLFLTRRSRRAAHPGTYQVQARIQAHFAEAPTVGDVDWPEVLALYDQLLTIAPTDTAALNRAVALAEVSDPAAALSYVESLGLDGHVYHAVRADLLARLGRFEDADRAWTAALARAGGEAEHARVREQVER